MSTQFSEHRANRTENSERRESAAPAIDWRAIRTASRACCCPARPAVVAVMPPAPGRERPTDLLLCGHHYRVSRPVLRQAGAVVFDAHGGVPVGPQAAARTAVG